MHSLILMSLSNSATDFCIVLEKVIVFGKNNEIDFESGRNTASVVLPCSQSPGERHSASTSTLCS